MSSSTATLPSTSVVRGPLTSLLRVDEAVGIFQINRRAFVDAGVMEREFEAVFDTCWLYLGHESQIPKLPSGVVSGIWVACTGGTNVSVQAWMKPDVAQPWVKVGAALAAITPASALSVITPVPNGVRVFLEVTAVTASPTLAVGLLT